MPHLLEHIREGRVKAKDIITHRMPLSRAAEAYRLFEQRTDGCVKCVLTPEVA
jgi:threonine dehydrogenase-like Zn-dependent dehydrogenase